LDNRNQEGKAMAEYLWLRLDTGYDFKKGGEPEIHAFGGDENGPAGKEKGPGENEIGFFTETLKAKEAQAKFHTLLVCHTVGSKCVWVKKSTGWVYECS
jgi:hypothetical protein